MLIRAVRYAVTAVLIGASPAGAQSAGAGPASVPAEIPAMRSALQTAPGGGDMVILGPESRYVTRAWRDGKGRVHAGCAREHGEATEQPDGAERR